MIAFFPDFNNQPAVNFCQRPVDNTKMQIQKPALIYNGGKEWLSRSGIFLQGSPSGRAVSES